MVLGHGERENTSLILYQFIPQTLINHLLHARCVLETWEYKVTTNRLPSHEAFEKLSVLLLAAWGLHCLPVGFSPS